MKRHNLIYQTLFMTCANFAVRLLGFAMRIWLSRTLGAEAVGVMELASSAHMLWLAPVTSGIPMAISRYVAQADNDLRRRQVLLAGKKLTNRISLAMFVLMLVLSPIISRVLGDTRTLPTLIAYLPCLPILGLSAVYNGYCYGMENSTAPAISELIEQVLRFAICFAVLTALPPMRVGYAAAVPAIGVTIGELVGLLLVMFMLRGESNTRGVDVPHGLMRKIWNLAFPMTCMRISNTLIRAVNAVLIPMRLRVSGLSAAEATARLGMYNGMAMSLIMMPAVFTGALAMVAAPAITKRENSPKAMTRLIKRSLIPTAIVSLLSAGVIWFGAPIFAKTLYRQSELEPLLKMLAPCVFLMGMQQVISGLLAGLGQQRRALYATLAGSLTSAGLNYVLAALPSLRLSGVVIATMAGQSLMLLLSARQLALAVTGVSRRAEYDAV